MHSCIKASRGSLRSAPNSLRCLFKVELGTRHSHYPPPTLPSTAPSPRSAEILLESSALELFLQGVLTGYYTPPRTTEDECSPFLFCLADYSALSLQVLSLLLEGYGPWGLLSWPEKFRVGPGAKASYWFPCSLPLPSRICGPSL